MKRRIHVLLLCLAVGMFSASAQAIPIKFTQVDEILVSFPPMGLPVGTEILSKFVLDIDSNGQATEVLSFVTTIPVPPPIGPLTLPVIPIDFDLQFNGALSGFFFGSFGPSFILWAVDSGMGGWFAFSSDGPIAGGKSTIKVPEPATLSLLLLGLVLIGARARRQSRL